MQQQADTELQHIIKDNSRTSLVLRQLIAPNSDSLIYCDISQQLIRRFVPRSLREQIFQKFHELSHPSIRATTKLIIKRFVWPSMKKISQNGLVHVLVAKKPKFNGIPKLKKYKFPSKDLRSSISI